ncbi:MAG: hypothetical protein J0I32_23225 [Sphingobacteriales bacterium]|nr:hypothetical protein [Sphingobacteriales bacterium]OJW01953.1 MAG: hypothetical protein BGO52_00270 [Sphingobacteriales bacterium 44-61]
MQPIKIIIDIQDAAIQAVYSNVPLQYIIVDHDCPENDEPIVGIPQSPDAIHNDLYQLYDSDTDNGLEIREALQQLQF